MKNLVYAVASIAFISVIGAAIYEHTALVPSWSAAPPASLDVYQGDHPLTPDRFWMNIHPVAMGLLILNLVLHWKTARRPNLLITLGAYLLVMVVTMIYFVPELLEITGTAFSETPDPDLTARAQAWETWSLVRLVFIIITAVVLLLGLPKSPEPLSN